MLTPKPQVDARACLWLPRAMRTQILRQAAKAEISFSEATRQLIGAGLAATTGTKQETSGKP